jgi:tetratricopeptide (TPR) repeat protein
LKLAKDEALACTMFEKNIHPNTSPYLVLFVKANLLYKTGKNDDAIDVLEFLHAEDTEIPFHHIDYMTGKAKLNRLDSNAGYYLSRFLEESQTKNYKREICMRLAYHYYMQGDLAKYNEYKNRTDKYSKATTDRDREADIEKNRKYLPVVDLLKARFLTSGGYFKQASQVLSSIESDLLLQDEAKSEYYLLIARTEFGEGAFEEAIHSCKLSISYGKKCRVHYPAEAALLAGDISKVAGNHPAAESYWKQVLKLDQSDDVYYETIQKKAKNKLKCLSKDKSVLTAGS